MSKIYEIKCWQHGKVRIEVERPPIRPVLKCPLCKQQELQVSEVVCKPEKKWQNYRKNLTN